LNVYAKHYSINDNALGLLLFAVGAYTTDIPLYMKEVQQDTQKNASGDKICLNN